MTATHDIAAADGGLSRRSVLGRGAAGLGLALTGSLNGLFGTTASAHGAARAAGYGPLISDPKGLLALPEGFSYTVVAQAGVTTLEIGEPTPGDPDGMAAFVRHGGNGVRARDPGPLAQAALTPLNRGAAGRIVVPCPPSLAASSAAAPTPTPPGCRPGST